MATTVSKVRLIIFSNFYVLFLFILFDWPSLSLPARQPY